MSLDYAQITEINEWVRESKAIRRRFRRKMLLHVLVPFKPSPGLPKRSRETNGMGERYDPAKLKPPSPWPGLDLGVKGPVGVKLNGKRWRAQITVAPRKARYLGTFDTEAEAIAAVRTAKVEREAARPKEAG